MAPSTRSLLLLTIHFATALARPSIIFPLYIYPSSGAWIPLTNVISANPTVNFSIIINPNSGPFPLNTPASTMSDYVKAMPNLTFFNNVKTFGYVDTNWPLYTDDQIVTNIDAWLYGPKALIPSGGIFFDDVLSTNASGIWQMNNVATYAREDNFTTLIFNVGTAPAPDPRAGYGPTSGLYAMADQVLVYENYNSTPPNCIVAPPTTNVASYITAQNSGQPSSKLTAMIYGLPSDANSNNVAEGCAKTKSSLCAFTASFSGVVGSLFVSDLAPVCLANSTSGKCLSEDSKGHYEYTANYTAVPDKFANFVTVVAGM